MLLQFSVENFLSFNQEVTLSMVGHNPIKEHEGEEELDNVFCDPSERNKLLKSCVIYGANGSGKSNLLAAFAFFKKFILSSSNDRQADDQIEIIPFLLSSYREHEPSSFEMIFYLGSIRYRYGFEVDQHHVHREWLFAISDPSSVKESRLFVREFQEITVNRLTFKEGKGIEGNTRPNALFLSTVAQLNGNISQTLLSWFKEQINIISGLEDTTTSYTVNQFLKDEGFRNMVNEFFRGIKMGFDDIEILEEEEIIEKSIQALPRDPEEKAVGALISAINSLREIKGGKELKRVSIHTIHPKFDEDNQRVGSTKLEFALQSRGTIKLFALLGPIIDTVRKGKVLVIDELDARLHTLLAIEIVKLFFHSSLNKQAQFIFVSHDTNLLRKELFRRDQIWFTEKDDQGATDLYSLVEYKVNQAKVRNDASFQKDYLAGKYAGIPFLGDVLKFTKDFLHAQEPEKQEA